MTEKKCEKCRKNIKIRRAECEEEGMAYHSKCFVCRKLSNNNNKHHAQ